MDNQPIDVLKAFKDQIENEDAALKAAADAISAQLASDQTALQVHQAQQALIVKQQALIVEFRAEVARIEATAQPVSQ